MACATFHNLANKVDFDFSNDSDEDDNDTNNNLNAGNGGHQRIQQLLAYFT